MKSKCQQCGNDYDQPHLNTKFCKECRFLRRNKNIGLPKFATDEIVSKVVELAGTCEIKELAEKLGMHTSSLKRIANTLNISLKKVLFNEGTVREVTEYYNLHGRVKTQEKFPHIKVRTIIERYGWEKGKCPRQRRWTPQEKLELLKFSGIVSPKSQAEYFNRPRAHEGSIKSVWSKCFKAAPGHIHGLPRDKAKLFIKPGCPFIKTEYGYIYLWSDLERFLLEDCPDFIKLAVEAMASFQRKLLGKDPYLQVLSIQHAMNEAQ